VRDQYDIAISPEAPPGEYQLEVGIYLSETGERLEAMGEEGAWPGSSVLLARIAVAQSD